ncbi:MAG TPA: hypothetical protein VLA32_04600 [Anaerolineales bacterium]|nr:hypothetical protein [Anaerolineales bacterium]
MGGVGSGEIRGYVELNPRIATFSGATSYTAFLEKIEPGFWSWRRSIATEAISGMGTIRVTTPGV